VRLLLDTNVFIWLARGTVSEPVRALYEDPDSEICVSTATVWEIAIKRSLGKLQFPFDLDVLMTRYEKQGCFILPVAARHAARVESLPWHHRDPFDRLLAATCLVDGYSIVSSDRVFDEYGVQRFE
jgi:PIN domain nuclease of toxin-antitoxin system